MGIDIEESDRIVQFGVFVCRLRKKEAAFFIDNEMVIKIEFKYSILLETEFWFPESLQRLLGAMWSGTIDKLKINSQIIKKLKEDACAVYLYSKYIKYLWVFDSDGSIRNITIYDRINHSEYTNCKIPLIPDIQYRKFKNSLLSDLIGNKDISEYSWP